LKKELNEFTKEKFKIDLFKCEGQEKELVRPLMVAYGKCRRVQTEGKYWTSLLDDKVKELKEENIVPIITDVRYIEYKEDEYSWIKSHNGILIHLSRKLDDGSLVPPANIEEKSNGIFKINVIKYPEYPIAYIRLCWDKKTSKYCMAQECDILKKCVEHRKFIIVGMRIPALSKENIFEQAFYLTSGVNSINSLNNNFKTKFIVKNKTENIWLPFSGFGYDYNDLTYRDNLNTNIKLLKNNFGHGCSSISNNCLYGRFGQYDPNLMQISYCLGGDFWENNIDALVGGCIVVVTIIFFIKFNPS